MIFSDRWCLHADAPSENLRGEYKELVKGIMDDGCYRSTSCTSPDEDPEEYEVMTTSADLGP